MIALIVTALFSILGLAGPAFAQSSENGELVLLTKQEVDLGNDVAVFDVSQAVGAYRAIRIKVRDGALVVHNVRVTFSDMRQHDEKRVINLTPGDITRDIGDRNTNDFVNTIRIEYERKLAGTNAAVEIFGRQTIEGVRMKRPEVEKNLASNVEKKTVEPPPAAAGRCYAIMEAMRKRRDQRDKEVMPRPTQSSDGSKAEQMERRAREVEVRARYSQKFDAMILREEAAKLRAEAAKLREEKRRAEEILEREAARQAAEERRATQTRQAAEDERRMLEIGKDAQRRAEPTLCRKGDICTPVRILFATDRQRVGEAKRIGFDDRRSTSVQFGSAVVTVPTTSERRKGEISRPTWIDKNIRGVPAEGDPKRHFTIPERGIVVYASVDEFVASMKQAVTSAKAFKDHAFIFVHGYNVSFNDALYRTAQLTYDLGDSDGPFGTAFLYSWPSAAKLTAYGYDEDSAKFSADHLVQFVTMVSKKSGAKRVHVIAHSMGGSALLAALQKIVDGGAEVPIIDQLVLAAPDVDAREFEKIAAQISRSARGTTLYASSRDLAMKAAREFRAGAPRAGDVTDVGPTVAQTVETIDMSTLSTSYFNIGHADFVESQELLNDIAQLLRKGEHPPEKRNINYRRMGRDDCTFWRYTK